MTPNETRATFEQIYADHFEISISLLQESRDHAGGYSNLCGGDVDLAWYMWRAAIEHAELGRKQ